MSESNSTHDLDSAKGRWFTTTHWSVVLAAGESDSPRAAEALEKLCRTYWLPLYAYVRRQGHSPENAQDLIQEFFAHFLKKNSVSLADRQRGRFRTFLLTSLQNFLGHQWERARAEKRGGGRVHIPLDEMSAERLYRFGSFSDEAPDKIFAQRWALTLFQQALDRLHAEFASADKRDHFERLKPFLSAEPSEGDYARVAESLGMTNNSVAVAVLRMRRRYGELVRQEIAHTVAHPAEIDDELRHLLTLVSEGR